MLEGLLSVDEVEVVDDPVVLVGDDEVLLRILDGPVLHVPLSNVANSLGVLSDGFLIHWHLSWRPVGRPGTHVLPHSSVEELLGSLGMMHSRVPFRQPISILMGVRK